MVKEVLLPEIPLRESFSSALEAVPLLLNEAADPENKTASPEVTDEVTDSEPSQPAPKNLVYKHKNAVGVRGLLAAFTILGLWATSLVCLLTVDFETLRLPLRFLGTLVQMFLYTGLFITAHDAMHGVVFPQNRRLNDAIGALAVRLYALFDFQKLLKKHWQHHDYPGSHFDPDFHNGQRRNFFAWYGNFMVNYWSWWRLFGLMATYNLMHIFLHIPEDNLRYFWILPSLLSSLQLFFFGTYLPHRQPRGGYRSPHRARSTALPVVWSFLTCYHFGYHEEHHAQPYLPWWALPTARRQALLHRQ